jgi:hypothetical protein
MFVFELRVCNDNECIESVKIDEVEFVILLRILKVRNQKLYQSFDNFYDKICEGNRDVKI